MVIQPSSLDTPFETSTTTTTDTGSSVTATMTPTTTTSTTATTTATVDVTAVTDVMSMNMEMRKLEFEGWSREELVQRLIALESQNTNTNTNTTVVTGSSSSTKPSQSSSSSPSSKNPTQTPKSKTQKHKEKEFDFSKHPTRKIALNFCYSGWEYCGLAFQRNHDTRVNLPTVEGVLWEAMKKARLVDPLSGEDLVKCGWEKCGRTDSGVSAAGQVVSLWIRSALSEEERSGVKKDTEEQNDGEVEEKRDEDESTDLDAPNPSKKTQNEQEKELDYVAILNRLLPPTIRVLAWSPVSEDFSARFSCKYRHYKYFFSNHSLNIPRMQEAAKRLLGEHDFRNLCKVDPGKQITRFKRVINRADISSVDGEDGEERGEKMYVFDLIGSAFLYHQVRHIMAILFVIGTGLEDPKLVTRLMNVTQSAESILDDYGEEEEMEVLDRRPEYQMVDGLPLMLWDCGYDEKDVNWRTSNIELSSSLDDQTQDGDGRRNGGGTDTDLYHQLHSIWNRSRVYTVLDKHFLEAAEKYHAPPYSPLPFSVPSSSSSLPSTSATTTTPISTPSSLVSIIEQLNTPINYPLGGGMYKRAVKYVPMLKRNRLDTVDIINERWRLGKGSRKMEKRNGDQGGEGDKVEGEGEE